MAALRFSIAAAAALACAATHPQDGPDADVRIRLERDALRCDLVFNLVYVDEVVELERADEALVAEGELPALRAALFEHLRGANAVEIDGLAVQPRDVGFGFWPAEEGSALFFPIFGARAAARVHVELEYPLKSAPSRIDFGWGSFPRDLARSTAEGAPPIEVNALFLNGAEEELVAFTVASPTFAWRAGERATGASLLALPASDLRGARTLPGLSTLLCALVAAAGALCFLSERGRRFRRAWALLAPFALAAAATARGVWPLALPGAGPALPNESEARAVFLPLHANIYRAFDYRGESEVYDALAQSVQGELLDRTYREIRASLVLQEAGGAVARVREVEPLETHVESIEAAPDGAPSFTIDARWRVEGVVHHFGHAHERTNEHRARYGLVLGPAGWRIAACEVLEQRRVSAEPSAPSAGGG